MRCAMSPAPIIYVSMSSVKTSPISAAKDRIMERLIHFSGRNLGGLEERLDVFGIAQRPADVVLTGETEVDPVMRCHRRCLPPS